MNKEYISHAAIIRNDGVIVKGKDHSSCIKKSPFGTCKQGTTQGFITNTERFVDRVEAGKIAFDAGQIKNNPNGGIILSEEIWNDNGYSYDENKGYYKEIIIDKKTMLNEMRKKNFNGLMNHKHECCCGTEDGLFECGKIESDCELSYQYDMDHIRELHEEHSNDKYEYPTEEVLLLDMANKCDIFTTNIYVPEYFERWPVDWDKVMKDEGVSDE
ncbi:hypothetical protein M0R36_10625 [bacterium]|jgi:hypothetical protein|nr:hypothetical protein [bacterium]